MLRWLRRMIAPTKQPRDPEIAEIQAAGHAARDLAGAALRRAGLPDDVSDKVVESAIKRRHRLADEVGSYRR